MYYRGAHTAMIVYDISNRVSNHKVPFFVVVLFLNAHINQILYLFRLYLYYLKGSFEGAKEWVMELKRNEELSDTNFVLVGNKVDTDINFRAVTYNEGKEYADSMSLFFKEVSAKTG